MTREIETGHLTGIAEMVLDLKVASGGKLLPGEAKPNQGIASLATHRHRRQLLLAEEIRLKQVLFSAFQVLLKKFFFFSYLSLTNHNQTRERKFVQVFFFMTKAVKER